MHPTVSKLPVTANETTNASAQKRAPLKRAPTTQVSKQVAHATCSAHALNRHAHPHDRPAAAQIKMNAQTNYNQADYKNQQIARWAEQSNTPPALMTMVYIQFPFELLPNIVTSVGIRNLLVMQVPTA